MSGKIILLEGADCSGKTTIAKRLAKEFGGLYYHNPAGVTELTQNFYNTTLKKISNEPLGITRLLQIAGNAMNARQMNQLRDQGKLIISDRHILSTLVYHVMEYDDINAINRIVGADAYEFDQAFLLTNSYDTLMTRIKARDDKFDEWDQFLMDQGDRLIERYRHHAPRVYEGIEILETDHLTLDEVYANVADKVKQVILH